MTAYLRILSITAVFLMAAGCASFDVPDEDAAQTVESAGGTGDQVFINDISSELGETKKIVRIVASDEFKFLSYKLTKPRRLAVEINGVKSQIPSPTIDLDDSLIGKITLVEFKKSGDVRVEISLKREVEYDLNMEDNVLTVAMSPLPGDPGTLAQKVSEAEKEKEKLETELDRLERKRGSDKEKIEELKEKVAFYEMASSRKPESAPAPEPKSEPEPEPERRDAGNDKRNISETIGMWLSAWQDKDIERYSSFYSEDFHNRKKNKEQWLSHKRKKFAKASRITVKIKDMEISASDGVANVKFVQEFKSDRYEDVGVKIVRMIESGSGWKIVSEKWSPLP